MTLKETYDELVETAKKIGIKVRKESGKFRSGYCRINEEDIILLNRSTTLETMSSVIAKSLSDKKIENIYIKPAIRKIIERERKNRELERDVSLEVSF